MTKKSHEMWGGRFEQAPDDIMVQINASIDVDKRLYRHDIQGSIAHVQMLAACGILRWWVLVSAACLKPHRLVRRFRTTEFALRKQCQAKRISQDVTVPSDCSLDEFDECLHGGRGLRGCGTRGALLITGTICRHPGLARRRDR